MDLRTLQSKLEANGLRIQHDKKGNPMVSMPVGSIPLEQYNEFQQVCDNHYNGNRWLMIWTLYMKAKQFDLEVEVEALRREIQEPVQEEEKPESNELGLLNN